MENVSRKNFKTCFSQIEDLFAKNKLREAFSLLEKCLEDTGMDLSDQELMELSTKKTVLSASFHRMQSEYRLGTIEWEKYDLSGTRIVEQSLVLAQKLCRYLAIKKSKPVIPVKEPPGKPSLPTKIRRYFRRKKQEERPPSYRIDSTTPRLQKDITTDYQQLMTDIQELLKSGSDQGES